MRSYSFATIAAVLIAGPISGRAALDPQIIVVCSPGSPGTTEEAQPRMDAFTTVVAAKVGQPVSAVYEPSAAAGVKRIASAGVAIVSLPLFLEHEKSLGLHARLQAVQKGRPALERWALVAQKGRVRKGDALARFTIVSNAAYAPRFVAAAVRDDLGALPGNVKLVPATSVVSALRRAASGEATAVLLDGPQAQALSSLPFADKLEVIARSPAWPAGIVATVDQRTPAAEWTSIQTTLLGLARDRAGAQALDALEMSGFTAIDDEALTSARNAYAGAR